VRAVIIQHEKHEQPAMLGEALTAAGFALVKRFREVKREDLEAELVVLLGGGMGVYQGASHPFLGAELGFVAERLALERPVLGICLGAQLLASAAGATVAPGKNGLELGVAPVRWTKAGQADDVLAGVGVKSVVAHWHGDTFGPVPGATLLASTDRYSQQAFRLGNSFGFQFHLELTARDFEAWLAHGEAELLARGLDLANLRGGLGKLRAVEAENRNLLDRLVQHFKRLS
jgi:GMP synthase (glutamine-hydrolysing)